MITNFEDITRDLEPEEKQLVRVLISGFKTKTKDNPIKAPDIIKKINLDKQRLGLKKNITEPRLRKLCNFIRSEGMIPLIATSSGYYVSYDKEEVKKQIDSLNERASAIIGSANGLKKFL